MILQSLSDQEVYDVRLKEYRAGPNQESYNEGLQKSQGVLWVEFTDHQESESQVKTGSVCADGFDAQKTNLFCKLLGFQSGTWSWHTYLEGTHDP